jgi:hypothetical protein
LETASSESLRRSLARHMPSRNVEIDVTIPGTAKAIFAMPGEHRLRLWFQMSLARFYEIITLLPCYDTTVAPLQLSIPRLHPRVTIKLPRFLKRLNRGEDLEIWSKDSFRGNWHVDFQLPDPELSNREFSLTLDLQARFAGTKHARFWGVFGEEHITLRFYAQ